MIAVRFNHVEEFLDELRTEEARNSVADNLIRLTHSYRRGTPFTAVVLIATFINGAGQIVRLDRFCGEYFGEHDATAVNAKADELADKVRATAAELELEVRTGVFEEAKAA